MLPAAVRKRRAGGGTHKGTPLMHGAGKSRPQAQYLVSLVQDKVGICSALKARRSRKMQRLAANKKVSR